MRLARNEREAERRSPRGQERSGGQCKHHPDTPLPGRGSRHGQECRRARSFRIKHRMVLCLSTCRQRRRLPSQTHWPRRCWAVPPGISVGVSLAWMPFSRPPVRSRSANQSKTWPQHTVAKQQIWWRQVRWRQTRGPQGVETARRQGRVGVARSAVGWPFGHTTSFLAAC